MKAFNHYKDIYLSKVHPLYTREAQLRKVVEDHSLYVKVQLDMDRLEESLSAVKSEVHNIETALKWEKVSLLQNAITESENTMQETERVVEQGNHDRCLEIFTQGYAPSIHFNQHQNYKLRKHSNKVVR